MKQTIAAMLAASLLAAGCGGSNQNASDEAREKQMEAEAAKHGVDADVDIDSRTGEMSVKIDNGAGATVGSNLKLPADFPGDVPIDPAWSIIAVSQAPGGGHMAQALAENETIDGLADKLRARLAAEGWTPGESAVATPQMTQLTFNKDDRLAGYTIIANGAGKVSVQVIAMKKP